MSKKDIHAVLIRNIRRYLVSGDFSQAELARQLGTYPATVSNWFTGKGSPSLAMIGDMARIFAVPPHKLFV